MEMVTGLVTDFTILSLCCQSCACAVAWYGGQDTDNFKQWYDQHSDCTINYTGSSNAMEKTAEEILWTNSVDKQDFRYTTMLSGGDSSTCAHLCALNVFGDDEEIHRCQAQVDCHAWASVPSCRKDTGGILCQSEIPNP